MHATDGARVVAAARQGRARRVVVVLPGDRSQVTVAAHIGSG
ncbi:hypothetical protein [Streptomyces lushanensis]|nr:hypothetical protein [Streptomyces lushanensis]